jgi:hypothetical protein
MILGIDIGFWYGMAVTAVITLVLASFAWLIPPKKKINE